MCLKSQNQDLTTTLFNLFYFGKYPTRDPGLDKSCSSPKQNHQKRYLEAGVGNKHPRNSCDYKIEFCKLKRFGLTYFVPQIGQDKSQYKWISKINSH